MRWMSLSVTLGIVIGLIGTDSWAADTPSKESPAVTSSETPSTRLYVKTVPSGANVKLDGKRSGTSDRLFVVPPGVAKMTVEVALDGFETERREVTIDGGRITRVTFELDALSEPSPFSDSPETLSPAKATTAGPTTIQLGGVIYRSSPSAATSRAAGPMVIPKNVVILSHVGDAPRDKGDMRSLGGSGHAIAFERPDSAKYLCAVQVFAGRYGLPTPPDEDFHVYVLDQDMKVLKDFPYPYGTIPRKGGMRWHTLPIPPVETPKRFFIALSFNPHETKGVYLGIDKNVKEVHSYVGLPDEGYEKVTDGYDWMVRACLVPKADLPAEENPFADQFPE